jgi:hypothetical protein
VINVKRREKEKQLEATESKPLDSVRGSEIKVNINPAAAIMSAVKPMRLSFKHIQEPGSGGGDTSTTNSPFKKRLNDIFSGGTNKCFAFDDIFLNTSPDQQLRRSP